MPLRGKLTARGLLGLVCLLTLLLAACGKGTGYSGFATGAPTPQTNSTPQAPDSQQTYRYPIVSASLDIDTFDPALATDNYSINAVDMVFNGLLRLDDNLNVQPELAQSLPTESSDGLQWTFHLRPGLTFSDGTPLTSADVAYSIDRALQPTEQSGAALTYLGLIKDSDKLNAGKIKTIIGDSILTPDASTVIIITNKKAAYFLEALTYPTSFVVEKKLIARYGAKFTDHLNEGEGGAGPFKVSQYIHGKEIDFVPNPYYYNLKPRLQKVVFSFVASSSIAYQEYQNGQLDETPVPADRFNEAQQLSDYIAEPELWIAYLAMNFLAKPFDNLYIRQAFALSIQRETINNTIYSGQYIATYHIIPQGMFGYNPNLTGPAGVKDSRGNIGVARQLLQTGLQQEGWSSVSQMPPIKLTYGKSPTADKLIGLLVQMWQNALGVNVVPNPVDPNTLYNALPKTINNPKGLQMWSIGWIADYPDPQDWTTLQFDEGSPNNYMNYGQNNTADAIQEQLIQSQLRRADAETDQAARILDYDDAEQQLVNEVAWLPLYQVRSISLLKPYVQGVVPNALSIVPPDDWANIYIGAH